MKKLVLFLALVLCVSMVWGQIISQYIETNSGTAPKGIEIWNNTGGTLDFSVNSLVIEKGANGGVPSQDYTLNTGTLAAGDVIVIGTSDMQTETENNYSTFYEKSFTFNGDDALVVKYGGTTTDVFGTPESDPGSAWSGNGVSTADQNIQLKSGISTGDTDGWTDPSIRFETVSTNPSNDLTGFGIAPGVVVAVPPSITNIVHDPSTDITSSTTVSVSADVTAGDAALDHVELHWNTDNDFGTYTTIGMSWDAEDTYVTDTDIPAQSNGTTVYYRVYAEDVDEESSTSAVQSYTVTDPATATLPYLETFDSDLGDCYTYSVSGATKEWYQTSGYAAMNGYTSGDKEEDWLILPGINLDSYSVEVLTFDSWYNYGSDDTNNYLKLMYSTDYTGVGDPSLANWTELSYTQPSGSEVWTSSGNIDLSAISGTSVWIAFKYHYNAGSYRYWKIDNISIYELTPEPSNHVSSFSATADDHQSITLTWSDNDGTTAAHGFLVGLTSDAENTFEPVDGTPVADADGPTDWVRNIAHGVETVTISGLSAETQYYAKIWPYTNTGDDIDYKTDGTVPAASTTTATEPVAPTVGVVFISEVADASSSNNEYLELFNNSDNIIDLTNARLVMLDDGNNYPFTNYTGDTQIPANGLFIIARGATLAEFETEWGTLPANCNYNEGSSAMYFGAGTARRWQLVFDDGTKADVIIDDTQTAVAGSGNRSYQQPIGTWNTDILSNATPGTLDPDQTLPVTLSTFTVVFANQQPLLQWTTQSETNNAGWNVYRGDTDTAFENESAVIINFEIIPGAGSSSEPTFYQYSDVFPVQPEASYYYWLESVSYSGATELYGPVTLEVPEDNIQGDTPDIPLNYGTQNYPNPFNPSTEISFVLAKSSPVELHIYNLKGRKIRTLISGETFVKDKLHTVVWDGKDSSGQAASSGIYFYRLLTQDKVYNKKMLLVK